MVLPDAIIGVERFGARESFLPTCSRGSARADGDADDARQVDGLDNPGR